MHRNSAIMTAITDLPIYVKVIAALIVALTTLAAVTGTARAILGVPQKLDAHMAQQDTMLTVARDQAHLLRQLVCVDSHAAPQAKLDCMEAP
jgi:hypothetical protein